MPERFEIFGRGETEGVEALYRNHRDGRPSAALIEDIVQQRIGTLERLRAMRADEASLVLSEAVSGLERRVTTITDGTASPFDAEILLAQQLRWCLWLSDLVTDQLGRDPFAYIEDDIDWVERSTRRLGDWDRELQGEASQLAAQVDFLKERVTGRKCSRFLAPVAPAVESEPPLERAFRLWYAVSESFTLEMRIAKLGRGTGDPAAEAGTSKGEGQSSRTVGSSELLRLQERRGELRSELQRTLCDLQPAEIAEFCRPCASELLDHSSGLLTETATSRARHRIASLRALRSQLDFFLKITTPERATVLSQLEGEGCRELARKFRQLDRLRSRTLNAEREEVAAHRLRRFFGASRVKVWENFILVLVCAFLALVIADWWLSSLLVDDDKTVGMRVEDSRGGLLPAGVAQAEGRVNLGTVAASREFVVTEASVDQNRIRRWIRSLHIVDLVFCVIFQLDFFIRWGFAGWRGWFFRRHFFFESLPALPYALLLPYLQGVIVFRLQRFVRLLRVFRVFAFFVRGADQAVERFRPVIDRDIILFETGETQEFPESPLKIRLLDLGERFSRAVRSVYRDLGWAERPRVLSRCVQALDVESQLVGAMSLPYRRDLMHFAKEVRLEVLIGRCLNCDVGRALTYFGREGAQRIAQWLRRLDIPIFRRAPFVRRLMPAARIPDPSEAASAAVKAMGQILQEFLGVMRFWGDMAGITTGPQILDRIATALVMATKRPAVRLFLLASLFLFLDLLSGLVGENSFIGVASTKVFQLLGLPLYIVGGLCLVLLFMGFWFKRIAGEALSEHLRVADAHFLTLIKHWKLPRCERDLRRMYRSVLAPEFHLRGISGLDDASSIRFLAAPVRSKLLHNSGLADTSVEPCREFHDERQAIALHYETYLDSPVLHREDNATSIQLLGNLALRDLRTNTIGLSRRQFRKLERLNLERQSILSLGPYFWFRFITESLAIETAKLVREYNASCIAISDLPHATEGEKARFQAFLTRHQEGRDEIHVRRSARSSARTEEFLTDEFSALNFLMPDDERDLRIKERFGDDVFRALKADRRGVVRDIFGTRPYHMLPRHERVFNPYRLFHKYLGGAKFFLLPLVFVLGALRLLSKALQQVVFLVREVLGRERFRRSQRNRFASFDVAVRKIDRMRKPFFMEALKLRATVDIDYLGLNVPGVPERDSRVTYEDDLNFVTATEAERHPVEEARRNAVRDLRRLRGFFSQRGWTRDGFSGLFEALELPESMRGDRTSILRALATAFVTDHGGLRQTITAPQIVREFIDTALAARESFGSRVEHAFFSLLFFLPTRRRRRRFLRDYLEHATGGQSLDPKRRQKLWRALAAADPDKEAAFESVVRVAQEKALGRDATVESFRQVAHDHGVWTQRLITVRTIQTITVLDIECYRDLIWVLGDYESEVPKLRADHRGVLPVSEGR